MKIVCKWQIREHLHSENQHYCIVLRCKCLKYLVTFTDAFDELTDKSLLIMCVSVIHYSAYTVNFYNTLNDCHDFFLV